MNNKTLEPFEIEKELEIFAHNMNSVLLNFFLIALTIMICGYISICWRTYRLRIIFIRQLLKRDAAFFDKTSSGHLSTILNDNIERIRESFNEKIEFIIQLGAEITLGFVLAFVTDWKLSSYVVLFALGIAGSGFINSASLMKNTEKQNKHYSNAGAIALQALSSFKTVISLNGQNLEAEKYETELKLGEKQGIRRAFYYGMSRCVHYVFVNLLNAVTLYIGANLIYDNLMTVNSICTTFFYLLFGAFSLSEIFPYCSMLANSMASARPIVDILNNDDDEIEEKQRREQLKDLNGQISFQNVHFTYPSRPGIDVLKGISFDVQEGECIAIVGASGSGKSTIVQLLLHFYEINSGRILIDNKDLMEIDIKSLRNAIGVVSQEPVLFNVTVEENIRFANSAATSAQIWDALKKANADDFVSKLPKGLKTVVGERGSQLSGGQKQRIAIARTLIRNPKILLLDEATSALDNESEATVQKALENASLGRTTIVIAHRLSTIRHASKIIVMKNGEIVEIGTHEELLEQKSVYSDLVQSQLFEPEHEDDLRTVQLGSISEETSRQYLMQRSVSNEPQPVRNNELERLIEELSEEGAEKSSFWEILKCCKVDSCVICLAVLACIIQGANYPLLSLLCSKTYEAYAMKGEDILTYGHFWSLMFISLAFIRGITIFTQYFLFGYVSERLSTRLRIKSFKHLLAIPCSFYDDVHHSPTRLSIRLNTDASNVKATIEFRIGNVITTFVSIVIAWAMSFTYSWQLTIQIILLYPILFLGEYFLTKGTETTVHEDTIAFEHSNKIATEALDNFRTVRALNIENKMVSMIEECLKTLLSKNLIRSVKQGISWGFANCAWILVEAISFKFGVYLVLQYKIMPMDVYKVVMFMTLTANTAGDAAAYFPDYKKAVYAGGLIFKLLTFPATQTLDNEDGKKNISSGEICAKNVHFHYAQQPNNMVLNGINFSLGKEKMLAIVGPSGCGKSTIIALLERFYSATEGEMIVDKENVQDINLEYLRSNVALVSQEPVLFNTTIRENLVYGLKRFVDQNEIDEALKQGNAYKFVYEFPAGLETIVGERGAQLSGGQKQRIAICRAILRKPKVLLLDEATSALDNDSEKVVQNALDAACKHISTVVVAHRLSTVYKADSIVVIDKGKVAEQGTHEELLQMQGIYWRLAQKQGKRGIATTNTVDKNLMSSISSV
ncbi:unnamed protein product [Caenorhabditis bovis]|uniref:Uncharacterized protein n=1 Tax=Caenorhabditis bovis TaxID=2654633 RepID=A0A8S1EL40_9PELO|nr:unnamed protein product [Caenorhabditis bovis]